MTISSASGHGAAPDALAQLRQLTQTHHSRLEEALQLDAPQMNLDTYTALLRRFHALFAAIESRRGLGAWAAELDALGLAWRMRQKLPNLEHDLTALQVAPLGAAEAPYAGDGIELNGICSVLGRLYVLEGATLGGQIISRNIHAHLGLTPTTGLAFFTGYGRRTGAMWRTLRGALAQRLQSEADIACAVDEAQRTFLLFYNRLVS